MPNSASDLDGIVLASDTHFLKPQTEQVWADEDAGDDVAQHHRLLEALKQHGHDAGGNHDHGQVLQKTHLMHDTICSNHARALALGQASGLGREPAGRC